ncbi:hypothetical protein QFZ40_004221 [Arthrobacter pascens]|uniref:DUF4193 domain-containing protein n=1 Tax=Arthrobacter pascens TaxID=1677 RepID=UPI0027891719|nr:DUF4193 domain-containing protein [Arthrobacter pascens]MDQ0636312.1 hypothetical protein [Arthrobacter pascens]
MSIDYDAPRLMPEDESTETLDGLKTEKTVPGASIDMDEADLADSFVLPGADLSSEELLVQLVPVQSDEFTCMSCFLVHHRSQLAREKDGRKFCTECEG